MFTHGSHLFVGSLEAVVDDVALLIADVGRVADGADHLHRLQDVRIHLGDRSVHFAREPVHQNLP